MNEPANNPFHLNTHQENEEQIPANANVETGFHSNVGTFYAEVIIPLALPKNFTWTIPKHLENLVQTGSRVEVILGKHKRYAGIVKRIHREKPKAFEPKELLNVLDPEPLVYNHQLQLWDWIAHYYMCSEGEVMQAALPSHLKLSSETILSFNEEYGDDFSNLGDEEFLVAEALLIKKELKLSEVQEILDVSHVYPVIKKLIEKGVCYVWEALNEKYKEKKETYIILDPAYSTEERLSELLNNWSRAPKQMELLLSYLHLSKTAGEVTQPELLKKANASVAQLKGLADKNILKLEKRSVNRIHTLPRDVKIDFELSDAQILAADDLLQVFNEKTYACCRE